MLFFSALDGSRKIGKPLSTQSVERLASTFYGERDRISTEGTRYEGVCREAHENIIETKTGGDMSTYRGIKVTESNLHVEKQATQPGVYRGVKHDAIESDKSGKLQNGVYRGVKHSA